MDALWKLRLAPQNRNALMIQQQQITRYNAQVAAHNRRRLRILKEDQRGKVEQKKYIAKMRQEKGKVLKESDHKLLGEIIVNTETFDKGNVIFFAAHITNFAKAIALFKNNYRNIDLSDISTFFIVLSSADTDNIGVYMAELAKSFPDKNFVFVHDIINLDYDFGKYVMAYHYFKERKIQADFVYVMNDSFIVTNKIDKLCAEIKEKLKSNDFVGIVQSTELAEHYQSWWLIVKEGLFERYFNSIKLMDGKPDNTKAAHIHINEVDLANSLITDSSVKSTYLRRGLQNSTKCKTKNLMSPNPQYFRYYQEGFNILKKTSLQAFGSERGWCPCNWHRVMKDRYSHFL